EFGGILLGQSESGENGNDTYVQAFEPLVIEHRYGPSYTLSVQDRRHLERMLKRRWKGLVPVGLVRSHSRRGLYLDQKDFDVFSSFFGSLPAVFLLIRRDEAVTAKGALFVWEDNDVRRHASHLEFPLEPYNGPAAPAPKALALKAPPAKAPALNAPALKVP